MKYVQKSFIVEAPNSDTYRKNWERTFRQWCCSGMEAVRVHSPGCEFKAQENCSHLDVSTYTPRLFLDGSLEGAESQCMACGKKLS